MNITDYIPTGKRNAVNLEYLKTATGKTAREIARLIREARFDGAVILTGSKGGYWQLDEADSDAIEQLEAFTRYMDSKNTYSAVKSAKDALRRLSRADQMQIPGV